MLTLQTAINDIISKNIGGKPEKKVLVYDEQCGLSKMLTEAYKNAL